MSASTSTASKTRAIRHHRKHRTGCVICKRKKVKCDEQKPKCSQCRRSSNNCIYANISRTRLQSSDVQTPSSDMSSGEAFHESLVARNVPTTDGFSLVHMELLYQWCTTTSLTMTKSPELTTLWRTVVTELAMKNDFLLWVILACSARHLSRLTPSKEAYYENLASNLQVNGLECLKLAQALPHVGEFNCGPVFIFSAVVFLNSLAMRKKPGDSLHIRSAADWVSFLKGTTSVAIVAKSWLPSANVAPFLQLGRIGPIMQERHRQGATAIRTEASERLDHLQTLINQIEDAEKKDLYTNLIGKLQDNFSTYHSLPRETDCVSVIFQWPALLPEDYVDNLMNCDPEAMILFAYYAVLMSKALPCWWLEGRPEWILASIHSHLGEYHRTWLRWPMEQLGWIPE